MARVVFFGSPDFALPSLNMLLDTEYRPTLVVTQPDRPAGRGKRLTPTPVRAAAAEAGIPVAVIGSFGDEFILERLRSLAPDFLVVVAFGLILPAAALEIAGRGNVNVHASLLPAYRGASPVNRAIVSGDAFTGVTTMEMVRALDAGPIYLQQVVPIDPMENAGELSGRLAAAGASLLLETLRLIENENLTPIGQPAEGASTAPRLGKGDGLVPWHRDAIFVHNHIRGMNPWPGSFTFYDGRYLKIRRAEPVDMVCRGVKPGTILETGDRGVLVAAGRGTVRVRRLQAEGKRPLDASEFLRGFPLREGEVFAEGSPQ